MSHLVLESLYLVLLVIYKELVTLLIIVIINVYYVYIYILYKDLQTGGVRTVRGGIWPPVVTMETHVGGSKYRNSILVSSSC